MPPHLKSVAATPYHVAKFECTSHIMAKIIYSLEILGRQVWERCLPPSGVGIWQEAALTRNFLEFCYRKFLAFLEHHK